ncbi:trafficking kinesin-binding protein 2 isoform X2 [Latimeria chalumnae]|uniref:Trafficking kinesin protein 2 n=1 Tax=Latimeria chalumnae TaxID=7897 RepID=H3ABP9_LATCH|nr:PREDICTED: trafficking kinesin-binding protein 2 isoform X2 [Latimeria chalumnae]|eukprot:XP_005995456.1 PREDICTED: trafficking kinesin-binding protein 2 isoform X2 [Latimeria chalumnae]
MYEVTSMNSNNRESGTITDVCSSEDLPEVELVSLLEDQLPQYRLRADSLYLYENQDWIQSCPFTSNASSGLSPILAEETFRYMVLGSNRVEQMTKTYNDIDMVTHLLAERDRDLELAARIGQALLQRNHVLGERNEALEEQLAEAYDQVNQLQHELSKKDELLRIVSNASEESETDSSCSTPVRRNDSFNFSQGLIQLDSLQNKLRELEEENLALRSEACHLKTATISYEEKEQQLVNDCVNELRETNVQIASLTEELSRKNEDLLRHQEEIANLLSQIVDLQHKIKEHMIEKEELKLHLQASKEAQRQLTSELYELQNRNAECLGMLHESQEEVKELRKRSTPTTSFRRHQSYGLFPVDSLAAEIEGTMRKELSLDEESFNFDQKNHQKRVFDTVRVVTECVHSRSRSTPPLLPIPGSNRAGMVTTAQPFQSTPQQSENKNQMDTTGSSEDLTKDTVKLGQPGTPGANDLQTALHRLSLRRENFLSEKRFFEEEQEKKLRALAQMEESGSSCSSPMGSFYSLGTNRGDLSEGSGSSSCFRGFIPEKLQIVKPIEGSLTLYQWQQLAQPNLGTLLDPRPGVVTKDFKLLPEDTLYHFSDLEEDEEAEGGITFQVRNASTPEDKKQTVPKPPADIFLPANPTMSTPPAPSSAYNPGKRLSSTSSTFTFTNCRILHPSDITQVTSSSVYAPLPNGGGSADFVNTGTSPSLSCRPSLGDYFTNGKDTPTTLSTTSKLTQLLKEHGISAQACNGFQEPSNFCTKKALAIPSTPPNSPCHSPCPSPIPFESRGVLNENFLASRPAEILLQEVYGIKPQRNNPDVGQLKMNLVERLKRLGIARVVKDAGQLGKGQDLQGGLGRQESALLVGTGSSLMVGLRRNQSLPTMIGGLGLPAVVSMKLSKLQEEKLLKNKLPPEAK